jgi:phage gp36-like protein
MAYCTKADIIKLLPEATLVRLTDDEGAGAVNDERVQEAIESAAEEMDTYLGARYALPLVSAVPILGKLNVDMAIFNLYSRVKETIPETRQKRYDNAVRFLEKVAEGKMSLGIQPSPDAPAASNVEGSTQVDVRTKIFDETTMDKY